MLKRIGGAIIRFFGRLAYRIYAILGVLLLAVVVLFTIFPQLPTGFHTALFVTQVLNIPVKPQAWFTQAPVREEITFPRADNDTDNVGQADVYYIPDGKRRAALLVFLGANAAGRDDRDVVNFGNALARAGYVPMFSWSPTMGLQNNVDPAEVENLVWAFRHLRTLDYVDPDRIGMAGFLRRRFLHHGGRLRPPHQRRRGLRQCLWRLLRRPRLLRPDCQQHQAFRRHPGTLGRGPSHPPGLRQRVD